MRAPRSRGALSTAGSRGRGDTAMRRSMDQGAVSLLTTIAERGEGQAELLRKLYPTERQ